MAMLPYLGIYKLPAISQIGFISIFLHFYSKTTCAFSIRVVEWNVVLSLTEGDCIYEES